MQKQQTATVTNKAQLLAAIEMAKGFEGTTKITLKRKKGKSIYKFASLNIGYDGMLYFNAKLNKVKKRVQNTPSECFI